MKKSHNIYIPVIAKYMDQEQLGWEGNMLNIFFSIISA